MYQKEIYMKSKGSGKMNDIEKAIETQQNFIASWEKRIQDLKEVIKKYPWGRDGLEYDFDDWRESESKRRKEQIKIALIIISALEKQVPKTKYNQNTQCGNCYATIQDTDNYCFNCGQRILQED